MNILVVGAGSIGKRHLRNLIHIGIGASNLIVVETRDDRRAEVQSLGIDNIFQNIDDATLKHKIDVAIICSPTSLHIEQAIELAKKNIHVLLTCILNSDTKIHGLIYKMMSRKKILNKASKKASDPWNTLNAIPHWEWQPTRVRWVISLALR